MDDLAAFVSVDIETAGPVPGRHALLSVGACRLVDPDEGIEIHMVPEGEILPDALEITGLDVDHLARTGTPLPEAMRVFVGWVEHVTPDGVEPVFLAVNAPFDWMFIVHALDRAGLPNPFGHKALDLKALYMGVAGTSWAESTYAAMAARYGFGLSLPHEALADARIQAGLAHRVLAEHAGRRGAVSDEGAST